MGKSKMILDLFFFALGVALIFKGSDYFVEASVAIGARARLPLVVVGVTLVSLATTTPEISVSIISGIDKTPGLAIGNALGSVAANIGFILALAAVIKAFEFSSDELRWRSQIMLGMAVLLFIMTLDLSLPRWRGFILLGIGIAYLFVDYYRSRQKNTEELKASEEIMTGRFPSKRAIAFFFVLGAAMVVWGSNLLVTSGISIARAIGVPSIFVGLTMVAMGTSLPELATAIASIKKGVMGLSIGNLIGASVLNLTIVTGTAASIYPLNLGRANQLYTFPAIILILTSFFFLVRSQNRLNRREGIFLMSLYLAFVAGLAILNIEL